MTTTMFHVTDSANADSILENGIRPQSPGGLTFFMDNEADAREYGELMPGIEELVVFTAEIMESALRPDSEEPGDYPAFEKSGSVARCDVELV